MLKSPWKSKRPLSFEKTSFKKLEDAGIKYQNFMDKTIFFKIQNHLDLFCYKAKIYCKMFF